MKFAVVRASFHMVARVMQCTRKAPGNALYGVCSEAIATNYNRVVFATSLQIISNYPEKRWAYALALGSSTHKGMSYLKAHLKFAVKSFF